NRHAGNVVTWTLSTGDSMLFLPSGIEKLEEKRPAAIAYWAFMQRELRRGGLELFVVLVPSKYTVYRRFLAEARPAPEGSGDYLARVEANLRRSGIPALNLTRPLSARAEKGLESREYLYWLDDIHWTPKGAEVAALAVGEALRQAFPGCLGGCGDDPGTPDPHPSLRSADGAETARRSACRWGASSASHAGARLPDSIAETSRVSSSAAERRTASNP